MAKIIDPSRRELAVPGSPQNLEVEAFNALKNRVLEGRAVVDSYRATTAADPSTQEVGQRNLMDALAKLGFDSTEAFFGANKQICYLEFLRCFEIKDDAPFSPKEQISLLFMVRKLPGAHVSTCYQYHTAGSTGEIPTFDYEWGMPEAWTTETEPVLTSEE